MNRFERKNSELLTEFDRYVIENPAVVEDIPGGAIIAMQLEDDNEFNTWSKTLAKKQAQNGKQIVFVKIEKLLPVHSRIEKLELVY